MEQQLSLHLKKFNERIKVMNQTNAKELVLNRLDAQNLHSEIFELLNKISSLVETKKEEQTVKMNLDGGTF